ncbi:MAG TPA: hypothetical protein VNZ64_14055 [Candidatus Acidoferrum sp.]|nr:hypothetical protein [Candidatus Acidoferrum sp.]
MSAIILPGFRPGKVLPQVATIHSPAAGKRQRTAALQNLAGMGSTYEFACVLECGCPLPLWLFGAITAQYLQSHPRAGAT